jgi:DNA-binding NarL/FixJ family response regulator
MVDSDSCKELGFDTSLAIQTGMELSARILIVDDHAAARTTIRSLLGWHYFEVCDDAKNGKEAIEKVIELKPDVVLLDLTMPVMNGIQAAYQIRRIAPSTKIVFFTIHEAPEFVAAMHTLGDACVSKSAAGTELIPTLNRLAGIAGSKPPDRFA